MSLNSPPDSVKPSRLVKLFSGYENSVFLPYFVWFLNAFNLGAIDRLMSKHATDFTIKQLRALIAELDKKYDKRILEAGSDDFVAALHVSINSLMESASDKKAKYFAAILAGAWESSQSNWDAVSQTLKLIRELEDVHILVLMEAAKLHQQNTSDQVALCMKDDFVNCVRLEPLLPQIDPNLLALALSDLVAKGMLNDTFESSVGMFAEAQIPLPLRYSINDTGLWFLKMLERPDLPLSNLPH